MIGDAASAVSLLDAFEFANFHVTSVEANLKLRRSYPQAYIRRRGPAVGSPRRQAEAASVAAAVARGRPRTDDPVRVPGGCRWRAAPGAGGHRDGIRRRGRGGPLVVSRSAGRPTGRTPAPRPSASSSPPSPACLATTASDRSQPLAQGSRGPTTSRRAETAPTAFGGAEGIARVRARPTAIRAAHQRQREGARAGALSVGSARRGGSRSRGAARLAAAASVGAACGLLDAEHSASSPVSDISVTMSQPPTSSPSTKSCGIVGQSESAESSWRMRGSGRMSTAANGASRAWSAADGARGEPARGRVGRALHEEDDVVVGDRLGDRVADGVAVWSLMTSGS